MKPMDKWLDVPQVGRRVMSIATRRLGTVDRIHGAVNPRCIVIFDDGETDVFMPTHLKALRPEGLTTRDRKLLADLRVGWD